MSTIPVWMHGELSKPEAEATLQPPNYATPTIDGTFQIRKRPNVEGNYVLMVVYQSKPTHHLIENKGGVMIINKKDFCNAATLEELVAGLSKAGVKGWPVPLANPIATAPGAAGSWLHGPMDNPAANAMLSGLPDGNFIVRARSLGSAEHVLSVNYRGKQTHHLVAPDSDGILVVGKNKQSFNGATTIQAFVGELSRFSLPKGWPVRLTTFAPSGAATTAAAAAPASAAAAAPDDMSWLHPPMTNPIAERLFTEPLSDGHFLIRERGPEYPQQYVVSVVYQNKPTHHLSMWNEDQGCYVINKKPLDGVTDIAGVVAALRTKRKNWPVPLTTHIPAAPTPAPTAAPDTSAADAAAAAKKKAAAEREAAAAAAAAEAAEAAEAAAATAATAATTAPGVVKYDDESWFDESEGGVMGFGDEGDSPSPRKAAAVNRSEAKQAAQMAEAEQKAQAEADALAVRLAELEVKRTKASTQAAAAPARVPEKAPAAAPPKEEKKKEKKKMSHQDYLRSIGVLPGGAPQAAAAPSVASVTEPEPAPVVAAPAPRRSNEGSVTVETTLPAANTEYTYGNKKKWTPPPTVGGIAVMTGRKVVEEVAAPKVHPAMAPAPSFSHTDWAEKNKLNQAAKNQEEDPFYDDGNLNEWNHAKDFDDGLAARRASAFGGAVADVGSINEPLWKKDKRIKREAKEAKDRAEKEREQATATNEKAEKERIVAEAAETNRLANRKISIADRMAGLGVGKTEDAPIIRRRRQTKEIVQAAEEEKARAEKQAREQKKQAEVIARQKKTEAAREQQADGREGVSLADRMAAFSSDA